MFFPELMKLKTEYYVTNNLLDKLDMWLALLNRTQKTHISPEHFAYEYDLDINVCQELFWYAYKIGILSINYDVYCPICDNYVTTINSLQDSENSIILYCDEGHSFDLRKFKEAIHLTFNLIKQPTCEPKKKVIFV